MSLIMAVGLPSVYAFAVESNCAVIFSLELWENPVQNQINIPF
jgi:hypothetical protein